MSYSIISPPNSFVDFNSPVVIDCLEQPDISLPAFNDFGIQFQFRVTGDLPATSPLKVVLLDAEGDLLLDQNIQASNLCYQYRLGAQQSQFPVTVNSGQAIPAGTYDYPSFIAALSTAIGTTILGQVFDYCCLFPSLTIATTTGNITFSAFWDYGFAAYPTTKMAGILALGDCFRYGIADGSGNILALSNKFRRVANTCFSTLLSYWNDDDAFGFSYPTSAFNNTVRLPFSFRKPVYPVTEQVYTKSDGSIKRASSRINKEYEGYTDVLTEYFHEKLIVAFKHDHVQFTNTDIGLVSKELFVQGDYKPDWPDEDTIVVAPAKFKISVPITDINSNCYSQTTVPCCPPVIGVVGLSDTWINVNVNFGLFVSSWNLRWRIAGTQVWNTVSNIQAKNYMIINLSAGTNIEYQIQSNCGSTISPWTSSYFATTTGTSITPCDSSVSGITWVQTGDGVGEISWTAVGGAVQWKIQMDQNAPVTSASPSYFPYGLSVGNHTIFITPICDGGTQGTTSQLTFAVAELPSITLTSSGTNGNTTSETFRVGNSVAPGNKFLLEVYSHPVVIVAVAGDTNVTIAQKLATALNNTTAGQWDSAGTAPAPGTPGFPPTAVPHNGNITITLDAGHQFGGSASVS